MKKYHGNPTSKPPFPFESFGQRDPWPDPPRLEHNLARAIERRLCFKDGSIYFQPTEDNQPVEGRRIRIDLTTADVVASQLTVVAARSCAYVVAKLGYPTDQTFPSLITFAEFMAQAAQSHDSGSVAALVFNSGFKQGALHSIQYEEGPREFRRKLQLWLDFRQAHYSLFEWPDPIAPKRNYLATNARFHVDPDGVFYFPSTDCASLWPPSQMPPTLIKVFPK